MSNTDEGKKAAAHAALNFVRSGMTLGLGTGSTVSYFLTYLGESGLSIQAIATSLKSEALAKHYGIVLLDPEKVATVDLTIDGADEIDPQRRMIKGGGGALLREKIAAEMGGGITVIVDASKQVEKLGHHPLPLEVLPWGKLATEKELTHLGFVGEWRKELSDNGNALFDIYLPSPLSHPEEVNRQLLQIPGVLCTGLFFGLASRVIVGYPDGKVQIL